MFNPSCVSGYNNSVSNMGTDFMPVKFSSLNEQALKLWCPDSESNQGHGDFQSPALPTELSGQRGALNRIVSMPSTALCGFAHWLMRFYSVAIRPINGRLRFLQTNSKAISYFRIYQNLLIPLVIKSISDLSDLPVCGFFLEPRLKKCNYCPQFNYYL